MLAVLFLSLLAPISATPQLSFGLIRFQPWISPPYEPVTQFYLRRFFGRQFTITDFPELAYEFALPDVAGENSEIFIGETADYPFFGVAENAMHGIRHDKTSYGKFVDTSRTWSGRRTLQNGLMSTPFKDQVWNSQSGLWSWTNESSLLTPIWKTYVNDTDHAYPLAVLWCKDLNEIFLTPDFNKFQQSYTKPGGQCQTAINGTLHFVHQDELAEPDEDDMPLLDSV